MKKKIMSMIVASTLVVSGLLQTQVQAAAPIGIYINGVKLPTDQAPVVVSNRALLPLRAIFESLDATVDWNQQTKVVTAIKDGNKIVLKLGAKTATINNTTVALDVPAQSIKGRILIPVRFVSEALGEQVDWNSSTQRVTITTSTQVNPVSYVNARVVGQSGNGSDLQVNFPKVAKETSVDQYRIFVVKSANVSSFNLANALTNKNYTSIPVHGSDVTVSLSYQAKDVNGDLIKANQSYAVYVLTVGKGTSPSVLSSASQTVTISTGSSVSPVSNITANDVSDYGNGRDLKVTFVKPQTDSNIANYRVMVVKTANASKFDLNAANAVSSNNYTTVSKSGSTLSTELTSSSRDTSGELLKNGVPYTVFVVSISNNTNTNLNRLASASYSITLSNNSVGAPVITRVDDVNNFGDGRDLSISFNKVSDESKIGSYRIFVVKASNVNNFNLSKANGVSSGNYTTVTKKGSNISQVLASNARDVDGTTIRNGVSYRVFVMSVGSGSSSGTNELSSYSSAITLGNNVDANVVTNLGVSDVSDYNDGRDLFVSFNRANDESNINHYRVMVVKSGNADRFSLSSANAVSSSNYTYVNKTGYNITQVLASNTRDVDGAAIRNGVSYRVFVLSVGSGNYSGDNALSSYSSSITLSSANVNTVNNLNVNDVSDYNDGRDLLVDFNRASDESNISHYRVMVVKTGNAGSFNLTAANAVDSSNFTYVNKTGNNISQVLASNARDVNGASIKNGVSYRVFVLSVANGNNGGSNGLSSSSREIILSNNSSTAAVTNLNVTTLGTNGDGRDVEVSFSKVADESNVGSYRIMVVRSDQANTFNLNVANGVSSSNYTKVDKVGRDIKQTLSEKTKDVHGNVITSGVGYQVFVLTVADGRGSSVNALAGPSTEIILKDRSIAPVTNVIAGWDGKANSWNVIFTKPNNQKGVAYYGVVIVPESQAFTQNNVDSVKSDVYEQIDKDEPARVVLNLESKDINKNMLKVSEKYKVYVITFADGKDATVNVLSEASNEIIFP